MVPDISQPETLAEFLDNYLNLTPEFECGRLSVEQIADVAMLAMAHSEGYAATAHLVSLWGGLPSPSDGDGDFWHRLWRASGTAIFLPANINHQVLRALSGDGVGLADQFLTAVSEMDAGERIAAALLLGEALEARDLSGYKPALLGELWLRDAETTAWKVLYAARKRTTYDDQAEFQRGWGSV
ncbi:hypothetical protein [Streptomyces sp. NPDC002346]